MKISKLFLPAFGILFFAASAFAQNSASEQFSSAKASPAYAVLVQHRANLADDLNNLQRMYMNRHPEVIRKQSEFFITELEMAKVLTMPQAKKSFLNEAYGELILSKITTENELKNSLTRFTPQHPTVIRIAEKLRAIEAEIVDYLR